MLHVLYQHGTVDPDQFSLLSFEADDHKLQNPVLPNKKRNILKRAKEIKTVFLQTMEGDMDELVETRPDQGDISDMFTGGSEKAFDIGEELCNPVAGNATHSKTSNVTPLASTTPVPVSNATSPRSYDASEPISAAPSPKPCDISLPVSTTATPGLGDISGVGSTQATDDPESSDDDKQNICGAASTNASKTTTIHEVEESNDDDGSHHKKVEIKEDEITLLSSLNSIGNTSDVKCGFASGVGEAESPCCSTVNTVSNTDALDTAKVFDQKYENLEMRSDLKNILQTSGVGSEDQSSKDMELQKENLRLSAENVELHFQLEQANKDLPRLKDQIADLKEMCEVLKKDKLEAERKLGNVRGSGRSGKTIPELEKTIGLMKRVVERVQRENENLKKAPGVVTNEKLSNLELENERLKSELEKLQLHVGGQLSVRYEAKTKGIEKVIAENERLRKEMKTETETSEKLRIAKRNLEVINEKLTTNLEEMRNKLSLAESRGPQLEGADGKAWKSAVVSKMYETKMKEMETELLKKNDSIVDLKRLLKEATKREQKTEQTIQHLNEEVELLKHFPEDAKTEQGLTRDFQILRLANKRLEDEKAQLIHQMEIYKQKAGISGSDSVLEQERIHKLMEEVVDLQTYIKTSDLEKQHLKDEIKNLKKELENFDPSFFEEIEDLKYNYNEEVKKNILLEEKLKALSEQFGVHVDIPANVDC